MRRLSRWLLTAAAGSVALATTAALQDAASVRGACVPQWHAVAARDVPHLNDLAVVSPTDVWAVGVDEPTAGKVTPAIVHWDGQGVRRFRAFVPVRDKGELSAVDAVGSDDVWAVGADGIDGADGSHSERPIALHWDGRSWSPVAVPHLRKQGYLSAVVAVSRSDVWAVGGIGDLDTQLPLVLHWDGRAWHLFDLRKLVRELGSALWAVDATSANTVWAVGGSSTNSSHVEDWGGYGVRWDGGRWRELSTLQGGPQLAVDVVGAREVWTLAQDAYYGYEYVYRVVGGRSRMMFRWHEPGYLADLVVLGRDDVWAVGPNADTGPLVLHWDGKHARVQTTPLASSQDATLNAVAALSPTDVWAVGEHLIARYSC